jgi:hypothetical protein
MRHRWALPGNGANGLMVLGLITEVGKHTTQERHQIVETVSNALRSASR